MAPVPRVTFKIGSSLSTRGIRIPNLQYPPPLLGVVPKKRWHIADNHGPVLPYGHSNNGHLSKKDNTLHYFKNFDRAVALVALQGKNGLMTELMKYAFRPRPVRLAYRELLGIHWMGQFYVDRGSFPASYLYHQHPYYCSRDFQVRNSSRSR